MEQIVYCDELRYDQIPGRPIFIDGAKAETDERFLRLGFRCVPFEYAPDYTWRRYINNMKKLKEIPDYEISLVIWNADRLLYHSNSGMDRFHSAFNKEILPYWEQSHQKLLHVFCVRSGDPAPTMMPMVSVVRTMRMETISRFDLAYLSIPVLRTEDKQLYLAAFGFEAKQIRSGTPRRLPRPTFWTMARLKDGHQHRAFYAGQSDWADFSSASMRTTYPVLDESKLIQLGPSCNYLYAKMNQIRCEIMNHKPFPKEKYDEYFMEIMKYTPENYQRFYRELSDIRDIL